MENKDSQDTLEHDLTKQGEIVTDLVLRVTALERILTKKNIVTDDEIMEELDHLKNDLINMMTTYLDPENNLGTKNKPS